MNSANISNSVLHSERKPQLSKSVVEKEKEHRKSLGNEPPKDIPPAHPIPDPNSVDHKVSALAKAEIAEITAHGGVEEFPDAILYNEDHGHLRAAHVAAHIRPLGNPLAGGRGNRRPSQVTAK